MTGVIPVQGRELSGEDIGQVQWLLAEHPDWGRTRLSEEICRLWDWRNALGRSKDMAARTLLLKLERSGHIQMPPRQRPSSNGFRNRRVPVVAPATETIHGVLCDLRPLSLSVAAPASADRHLFNGLLAGNVMEWCQDWYNRGYYSVSPKKRPKGPEKSTCRVLRGGSFFFESQDLRSRAGPAAWKPTIVGPSQKTNTTPTAP